MDEVFLGSIKLYPFNYAPMGWMLCDGTTIQIRQNQALFALISTKFGGDGKTTFALPNLANTSPVAGMEYYIAMLGIFPSRP